MNIYFLSGKEFDDAAHAGANFHHAEGGLRVVGTLVLIPLANLQVANQVLAGHTMPVSLERSYPVAGVQMNCTRKTWSRRIEEGLR